MTLHNFLLEAPVWKEREQLHTEPLDDWSAHQRFRLDFTESLTRQRLKMKSHDNFFQHFLLQGAAPTSPSLSAAEVSPHDEGEQMQMDEKVKALLLRASIPARRADGRGSLASVYDEEEEEDDDDDDDEHPTQEQRHIQRESSTSALNVSISQVGLEGEDGIKEPDDDDAGSDAGSDSGSDIISDEGW